MTDDKTLESLRLEVERLDPSADARKRITDHIDLYVGESTLDAKSTTAGSRRSPRRAGVLLGAAGIAATIALVSALGPSGGGSPSPSADDVTRFVGPDTAAARELIRAGDAAADAQWSPLGNGEYFHLYSMSVPGDDEVSGGTTSFEMWLDRDGHGQVLSVTGAADPDRMPTITPGGGVGYNTTAPTREVTPEESLTKANSVNLMAWPVDAAGLQRSWVRTRKGFVKTYDSAKPVGDEPDSAASAAPATTMLQFWGITIDDIDKLPNSGGRPMDDAVAALLNDKLDSSPMRSNRIPTGAFGVTRQQLDTEERIQFATTMLGAAPLPPEARRSLYRWLASQPGAKLDRDARDALGRSGMRVTFEHAYDEDLPARTVTVADLIDTAVAGGAQIDADAKVTMLDLPQNSEEMAQHEDFEIEIPRTRSFSIPAHTETRTWRVTLIVDPDTGELLQHQLSMTKHASAGLPELAKLSDHIEVIESGGHGSSEMMSGSGLIVSRGRATLDEPESPVCNVQPEICTP